MQSTLDPKPSVVGAHEHMKQGVWFWVSIDRIFLGISVSSRIWCLCNTSPRKLVSYHETRKKVPEALNLKLRSFFFFWGGGGGVGFTV